MQVILDVQDEICREAGLRGLPVIDFVERLIAKGFRVEMDRPEVLSAIERIRALRSPGHGGSR